MAEEDPIFQGNFFRLSESRRLFIGSKSDSWKPKFIVLRKKGDKLALEYHKKKQKNHKKGERTLTNSFELWPTFKVEKLTNARGRSFVCEITAPDIHQFLSADEESDIDVFVFLLQSQIQLKENLREDIIRVVPDESDSQTKIGAKGSRCFLHISPWGITLAFKKSRALLAQWPLKSIRYYETSGNGHFTIEAGRVAPMGEGVFGFRTAQGDDDKTYDLVDNYIVNTLDRVKPSQRGTQEEIEDYIREHDFLHSLTMVRVRPKSEPELKHALKQCWNIGRGAGREFEARSNSLERQLSLQAQTTSSSASRSSPSPSTTVTSSLNRTTSRDQTNNSTTTNNGPGSSNTYPIDGKSSSSSRPSSSLSDPKSSATSTTTDGRPPLPGRAAKRSRRRDHSLPRKIDVVQNENNTTTTTTSSSSAGHRGGSRTPELPSKTAHSSGASSTLAMLDSVQQQQANHPPRRHSNPSNVLHSVHSAHHGNTDDSFQGEGTHQLHPNTQRQHTEFYNLNSPNLKIRVSKSPVVTRHLNKVGRAEYLISVSDSGVRSPEGGGMDVWDLSAGSGSRHGNVEGGDDDENQETRKYLDAVSRASQKKYGSGGGSNSLDRTAGNNNNTGSNTNSNSNSNNNSLDRKLMPQAGFFERDPSRQSLGNDSIGGNNNPPKPGGYVNCPHPGGYISLHNNNNATTTDTTAVKTNSINLQDRQNSVESFASALSRQNSSKTPSSPPPPHHHHRQRSAPVDSDCTPGYQQGSSPLLRRVGGGGVESGKSAGSSHEDSGVSLRSVRHSQLSSDDGLSRDSALSIGSFKSVASRQTPPQRFSGLDDTTESSPVTDWLMSASCEDLSDHMRCVIFQDDNGNGGDGGEKMESTYEEIQNTDETDHNNGSNTTTTTSSAANNTSGTSYGSANSTMNTSDDKPPLPFTGLKKFQNNAVNSASTRDRSKSFGYMNLPEGAKDGGVGGGIKQPSSAPSAHLIRKMVSARAKQETLRKSLSNPNFLNLGSKEQLFKLKINHNMASSNGNLSSGGGGEKLGTATKAKSRSFGNLFPAIKRALSRESVLAPSRSTTPERRRSSSSLSRRSSFSFRRRSSDHEEVGLRRQNSLHTPGEMTIKGIRMTARSRSFRRVRGTKSVDGLSSLGDATDNNANKAEFSESLDSTASSGGGVNSRVVQMRTSSSSASIKTLKPNNDNIVSNDDRDDTSTYALPHAAAVVDSVGGIRKSASGSRISSVVSSSGSNVINGGTTNPVAIPRKASLASSSSILQKSELPSSTPSTTNSNNKSYSSNINFTLTSPVAATTTNAVSSPPPPSASTSSTSTTSSNPPPPTTTTTTVGVSSLVDPPPPPIPPRQRTSVTTTKAITISSPPPSLSSSSGHHNHKHVSTKTITATSKPSSSSSSSNYINAQFPGASTQSQGGEGGKPTDLPIIITASSSSSPSSIHRSNYVRKPPHSSRTKVKVINMTSQHDTSATTTTGSKKGNSSGSIFKEVGVHPSTQVNGNGDGERSRPTRRRTGFDKVAPKS